MSNKKTLVVGASTDTTRFSNMAVKSLAQHGHEVVALGAKAGEIGGIPIHTERESFEDIDTVTLYLNPQRQEEYYDYIVGLHPKRIIFNPGTENEGFATLAKQHHIATENACTLVLLNTGQY
jgi:predicted CoA-binding protein